MGYLLTAGALALSPVSALAARYDALCGGAGCSIGVTAEGISAQGTTIPAHRVTSWSMGGNSETDVTTGVITTFVFGLPGLLGFGAKKHDYNFNVSGYDENGKKTHISFQFINDKPVRRLAAQLPGITGLGVNQNRTLEEIVAFEEGKAQPQTQLGRVASAEPSGLGRLGIGGPSLPDNKLSLGRVGEVATPKNCWSTYLSDNPAMAQWAEANPALAEQNKKRFDAC